MQYIDQDKIILINPRPLFEGIMAAYYSTERILKGDILYTVEPERTVLWEVIKDDNCMLKPGTLIRVRETNEGPVFARYRVVVKLSEIPEGPEHDRHLEEMAELEGLPF